VRGRPLLELLLVGAVALALWFPLKSLTQVRVFPMSFERVAVDGTGLQVRRPVWIDLRFSHMPERFEVFQGEILLGEGGGDLRWDEDAEVSFDGGVVSLRIEGRLAGGVDSAYLEVSLEPDRLPPQRRGMWIRDDFSHVMEFRWTEN